LARTATGHTPSIKQIANATVIDSVAVVFSTRSKRREIKQYRRRNLCHDDVTSAKNLVGFVQRVGNGR